ncbi:Uncharacterised protein [Vibrio cholerae]|uniref:Uncharacterized protein n=1 Tax=Vibrio cholerae TaxID=666 RepID=A0A655Y9T7_VIBCL|nr:Uncharacterised protein [Vibrio cholerae]CSA29745.1 Uncharacterised protein [Vibrio cholerae]CSB23095.1 Uncharacterised protein [Vibrio cholerae]CSB25112.1 Uncharacterised protein [Vibrio cholerae]CSB32554.1 Uncharacterised protein [Vibrio cholerae]
MQVNPNGLIGGDVDFLLKSAEALFFNFYLMFTNRQQYFNRSTAIIDTTNGHPIAMLIGADG